MNIYLMKKPKRINSVSVTLFIGALIIGYLLYWWVPILWPVFQMSGIMRSACNQAYRMPDDQQVMQWLVNEARRTNLRVDENNFRFERIPYSEDDMRALNLESDHPWLRRGKACRIAFHYEDDYPIPLTGKTLHLPFDRTIETSLAQVQYEKLCTCVTVPGSPPAARPAGFVDDPLGAGARSRLPQEGP